MSSQKSVSLHSVAGPPQAGDNSPEQFELWSDAERATVACTRCEAAGEPQPSRST